MHRSHNFASSNFSNRIILPKFLEHQATSFIRITCSLRLLESTVIPHRLHHAKLSCPLGTTNPGEPPSFTVSSGFAQLCPFGSISFSLINLIHRSVISTLISNKSSSSHITVSSQVTSLVFLLDQFDQ